MTLFLFRSVVNIFLIFITTLLLFLYSNKILKETYINISLLEIEKILTKITNDIILNNYILIDDLLIKDELYASFNMYQINQFISQFNEELIYQLDLIEKGESDFVDNDFTKYELKGIIYQIPFSLIYNNALLNDLKTNIPIKIKFVSNAIIQSSYSIESFGINNALISIIMNISFSFYLYIPLNKLEKNISLSIPLSMKLIEGEIPNYLLGNYKID